MGHLHYTLFTQWLHLHPHWGGVAAFIIAFAESIAIVGTIVPGSVTMTAIGILAGSGVIPVWVVLLFAILGAVIGDGISYFFGYFLKDNVENIWPFKKHPTIFSKGERFFEKYGIMSVVIGRFVGPVRAIVPVIAGMLNMKPKRYFLISIPTAIAWAPTYMLPGFLLGAVSLEMPPDLAAQLIIAVLAILVLIWAIAKGIGYIYTKTHTYFATRLDTKWQQWSQEPSKRWFCYLLRHAGRKDQRGQLLLAINFFIGIVLFLILFINVVTHGPLLHWNNAIYHLLRGLRTPSLDKVMIVITTCGYKYILAILVMILTVTFLIGRHWKTAFHWLMNFGLASVGVMIFKHWYYSPRPTGIFLQQHSSSFPSGHTTLSVATYTLFAYLLCINAPKNFRKIIVWITACFCFAIGLSRMYLGAHWLTDIIGGALLGLTCTAFTVLSYRRFKQEKFSPLIGCLVALLSLTAIVTIDMHIYFHTLLKNSQPTWKQEKLSSATWWHQHSHLIPLFRTNRLGSPFEILNVQWAGNLHNIRATLKQHGWRNPHTRGYLSTLETVAEQSAIKHQSLLPKLYKDQKPALELVKFINKQSPPLILRLWDSHILLFPRKTPLWVGTVYYDMPGKTLFQWHLQIKQIHIESAANTLLPSLIDYTWYLKIVSATNLPTSLIQKQFHNRIIVIKPKALN